MLILALEAFLRNHAPDIAAMDLFVVPTIGFNLLYAFVIIRLDRRDLVWINVTTNLTAEWIAHQITEAFPWDEAPRYLHSRSGSDLRRHRHTPIGYPGQADGISFTLAEWLCRTADRIDPTRVCGPHHCLWRGTPAPDSAIVCLLLQRDQNSPVIGQGCADLSPGSADRCHHSRAILGRLHHHYARV